ncbi:hypothetical protein L7F22_012465 [Adiantum nelumboides]|nr:hypothetical protein [Adiantum nelumboides]
MPSGFDHPAKRRNMVHKLFGCQSGKTCAPDVQESVCEDGEEGSMLLLSKEEKLLSELACLSCLPFQNHGLSPQKKFSKLKALCSRSSCFDFHNMGARGSSAFSANLKGSTPKLHSQKKGANGGIAWLTLPGFFVDADDVISDGILKLTGPKETIAWNAFAPLQKVLVVAVTAAAASTAKQKYSKEMRKLQCAIDIRDKEMESLRQKISQLQEHLSFWKEQAQNLSTEAKESVDNVFSTENGSSLLQFGIASTPKGNSLALEQFETPQIGKGLEKMPEHVACVRKHMRAASFRNSLYRFGSTMSRERSDHDNLEIRTFLDGLSESPLYKSGQFDAWTPDLPLTKLCMMDTPQLPRNNISAPQARRVDLRTLGLNTEK